MWRVVVGVAASVTVLFLVVVYIYKVRGNSNTFKRRQWKRDSEAQRDRADELGLWLELGSWT